MGPFGRQDVRILLLGERGVGKTSLILSLVSEEFPDVVPPRAEEITIPADVTPEQVPTHIVDFSESEQTEQDLAREVQRADVVCLVYAVDDNHSLQQITERWLPLLQSLRPASKEDGENQNGEIVSAIPIILVGNKSDLLEQGNMESVLPIMNHYAEIETCVECSARTLRNISEMFYYAQKAVLHPTAPLYIAEDRELTEKCKRALRRIFAICDRDGDGSLSDAELNAFQQRCFGTSLQNRALEDVRNVVRRHTNDGVGSNGLTLSGFLFLHRLFIQRGRHETTWTVLRKFGYDDYLNLSRDYLHPPLRVPPGCNTEFSASGWAFLVQLFEQHDKDKDGALNTQELASLFSPCSIMPWGQNLKYSVPTNVQGWPTLKGYMAQWSLMTYLDVRRTCELLAYLGYHTAGTDNQLSAITVTKAQRSGGSKKRNTRTVFMGHVIGPPGVGKTTFCQGLLGRTVDEIDTSNLWCELPRYVARQLSVYGQSKILLLHDVDALGADSLSPQQVSCDVACLVYDASDEHSFEHVARLYLKYFAETSIPVLIVASKWESGPVRQQYLQQPETFCRKHRIPPPHGFSAKAGRLQSDVYIKLATMSSFPSWRPSMLSGNSSAVWIRAVVGLAAATALGLIVARTIRRLNIG
uniref:Mitochondrial Rho GTPase n=1 Tax=Daphnia galeata TaxID=27404 RepID=A0A8J2W3X0_9CRUS|nr:unnamed protein product [Daphnia galeata]